MIARCVPLAFVLLALAACRRADFDAGYHLRHSPPQSKDIIEAVLANSHLPLEPLSDCRAAGTQSDDRTLGHYVSGFLAELNNPSARNAVTTSVEDGEDSNRIPIWICRVMIRHAEGEDIWSWGLQFHVRKKDALVDPASFRCLGAG